MKRERTRCGARLALVGWAGRQAGFSLAELLVVCLLGSLVGGLVLGLLLVLQRGLVPRRLSHEGEILALAPCFDPLPAALSLHQVFRAQLSRCSAAYVFGGRAGGAPETWAGTRALALRELPRLADFSNGLPANSGAFAEEYAERLGGAEPVQGPEDFTVLLLGRGQGEPRTLCLVQCRSVIVPSKEGEPWKRREVRLWGEGGMELSYAFAEPVAAKLYCGVMHSWYRSYSTVGVAEEGPATVVFPDPWVFVGTRTEGALDPAGSRFSYFLPVYP